MSNILELQNIDQYKVLMDECTIPIVLKFSAEFCGPCKAMQPKFDELARKYQEKVVFVCIDIEELEELAEEYEVRSIPTMVVLHEGVAIKRTVGGGPSALKDIESAIVSVIS